MHLIFLCILSNKYEHNVQFQQHSHKIGKEEEARICYSLYSILKYSNFNINYLF